MLTKAKARCPENEHPILDMIFSLMNASYEGQLEKLCEEHGVAGCVTVLATDPTWKVSDLGVDLSAVYSSLEGKKSISAL